MKDIKVKVIKEHNGIPEGSIICVSKELKNDYEGMWASYAGSYTVRVKKKNCEICSYSTESLEEFSSIYDQLEIEQPKIEIKDWVNYSYGVKFESRFYDDYPEEEFFSSKKKAMDYITDFANESIDDVPYEIVVASTSESKDYVYIYEIDKRIELYEITIRRIKIK